MNSKKLTLNSLLLFLISLVSHLPFLWAGYGREEDAWAQALNAKLIWENGQYEVSRLPGHPLLELLLASLWPIHHSPFFFNLISTLVTSVAVVIFYRIAAKLDLKNPFELSIGFLFVPTFFIAGTYTIDYNYALVFILASFYAMLNRRFWLAGILLGIATGFRISSLGFVLPFLVMFWSREKTLFPFVKTAFAAGIVSVLSFTPALLRYGSQFLDFHKPPFISWANTLYKISFGVWGVPLLIFLLALSLHLLLKRDKDYRLQTHLIPKNAMWGGVVLIFLLQLFVFLRLPFKSEFFIPFIPFALILVGMFFRGKHIRLLAISAFLSTFFFGFDYVSSTRGAQPSGLAVKFSAGGKTLFFDPLQGPAIIDHQKREVKTKFLAQVADSLEEVQKASVLIAGWYYPELVLKIKDTSSVKLRYYLQEEEIKNFHKRDFKLYYLPEIDQANANVRGHYLADSLAQPLFRP